MYFYSVYGLVLRCEFPVPELLTCAGREPDVAIRLGVVRVESDPASADESWAERHPEHDEASCVFAGVGRYQIRAGREIVVDPAPAGDFALVRHLLLGPVLAHLLWQRGIFTLHASVIGVLGPAPEGPASQSPAGSAAPGVGPVRSYVAFVGASGEGKSTTAAALEAAGHLLVCDDVAALTVGAQAVQVLPGFPRMRLYPDTLRSLGEDPARHPRVHGQIDKHSKRSAGLAAAPVVLDRLYVLASGEQLSVEPLPPRPALMEVMRNTYYAHQFAPLYGFPQHMEQAARITERVAAFRLTRPRDLARLPELVALLEACAGA